MNEVNNEAKDFDSLVDNYFKDNPELGEESSPEQVQNVVPPTENGSGAEPEKTEQVKEVEADGSLNVEQKLEKVKEILGDDQDAIDAYVKSKGFHNDPAWQKQREIINKLKEENQAKASMSEEDRKALDEFNTLRNSPEYIQMTMKQQGYTQEAINAKLQEVGHEVTTDINDDVTSVLNKLGVDKNTITPDNLRTIEDIVKIANALVEDKLGKTLPKTLEPIQQHIGKMEQSENASIMVNQMKEVVKSEGILDFSKDVEPALNKFIDENPDALQSDIKAEFEKINHNLSVARLKLGNKQGERDELKSNQRQNLPIASGNTLPQKTGDFDKDADAFFDSIKSI